MKTTEQRAVIKADAYYCEDRELRNFHSFYDGYIRGAEDALESQWVSVKDGLPDDGVDVFVAYRDRLTGYIHYSVACTYKEGRWYSADDEVNFHGIVAWMPIPYYKGKEDSNG